MKNYTCALTVALLSCSFVYSDEAPISTTQIGSQHHRLYVGPDVFVEHAKAKHASGGNRIDITSNAVFGGLRLGYDYVKPEAFYFGMDGLASIGKSSLKSNLTYWSGYNFHTMHQKLKNTPLFANIEQRYGYNFQSPISAKSTLTPFAGIGWYYVRPQFDSSYFSVNWFYGAAGLRLTQEFCENFDLGLNLKAMYTFAEKMTGSRYFKENIKHVWGYEVALPLTWHIGPSKSWDLQLQPYLLKLDVNSISYILGVRLQIGYSF